MQRIMDRPRPNWQREVEELGFTYHTINGDLYWDEAGWYEFALREINTLERATNHLHQMCLEAVQYILDQGRLSEFGIPTQFHDWIHDSWEEDQPTIYGRFDLAWDGRSSPKLLEYNADTPTALFEAAVVQWQWLESRHPSLDQFNSLHEKLLEGWSWLHQHGLSSMSFSATEGHEEDFGNVTYMRDTAAQSGIKTSYLDISQIGYNIQRRTFVDCDDKAIECLFKLYPWEWMLSDEFALDLLVATTRWIEPPWKMLLSNKALLVILWEMFPQCDYLLPAAWEPLRSDYVRKPILSREGSNIQIVGRGHEFETDGPYDDQPVVYQAYTPLPNLGRGYAVLGSWIIGDSACGLGVREDESPVTHNTSRFVPHLIRG